jgi:hypothetical protein
MRALIALVAFLIATPAWAQSPKTHPEVITFQGYGFAWQNNWRSKDEKKRGPLVVYDVVSAWHGPALVADCAAHQSKLRGAIWCFASAENKATFDAATEDGDNHLLPFGGGRCTAGLSIGMLTPRGDPRTARVMTNLFGDGILVTHSNQKWWPGFTAQDLKNATLAFNLATATSIIVPNDKFGE